ncbi:MAG TPA: ABC transporter ATP-binding protein, partial [Terriglobales bacterium]|nr:ABC transporter ATP-binding protein [Terriglobales bacterium]
NIHEEEVLGKAYDSRLMKRLLTYLRPYKWHVFLALTAIVLQSGADVLGPYLTKTAVDKYLARTAASGAAHSLLDRWLSSEPLRGMAQIAGLYVLLLVIGFVLEFVQIYLMQWTGQKVMFDLRSQIFRHLQRMQVSFYDRNPVGRLVTRVTTDVDSLNEMFTSGVVAIFQDIFVLAGIVIIMLKMKWWLALITFAVLPFIFVATMIFRARVRDSYRRIRVAIARINAYLQEHVSGIVVLQLFNRERRSFQEFDKVNRRHMDAFKDAIMAHAVYYPVVEILSATAIAGVFWFGGNAIIRGMGLGAGMQSALTIGVLVAFMQYAQRFFRPIQDLSEKYNILQSAMASSERVFKLLDTPIEITSPVQPKKADGPGRIEFDHVWFAYRRVPLDGDDVEAKAAAEGTLTPASAKPALAGGPGGRATQPLPGDWDWVLRDVSFVIEPGETAAIVGHTGAGKTTIISLLLRFYDVQQGAIRLDGVDVREMDIADLRRRFGVVLQDPFLFSGTVRDNIRLGSEWIEDERVEQAAEEVNVADFIRSLPQGFHEPVRERGSTLSTGQKQLISFARALAHDPRILVLDEATSSVDTETEFRVRDALTHMVEGRTSVVIAHRLSTIQRADKILVMHKGRLREVGSHQELLAQRGIYWKLYQLQYKDQEVQVSADD